ncbi:MAG: hypothetical protein AB7V46_06720 [Thermomicrobiales bacterium]
MAEPGCLWCDAAITTSCFYRTVTSLEGTAAWSGVGKAAPTSLVAKMVEVVPEVVANMLSVMSAMCQS